jgi:hypothetical protein
VHLLESDLPAPDAAFAVGDEGQPGAMRAPENAGDSAVVVEVANPALSRENLRTAPAVSAAAAHF